MRWLSTLAALTICILLGCADGSATFPTSKSPMSGEAAGQENAGMKKQADKERQADQEKGGEPIKRKIIYTARAELSVEKFEKAEEDLMALIKKADGYLAKAEDTGSPGGLRSGTWTVRVPVENFESFMADVVTLGELRRKSRDTQDITDQYYDTEARMKNDKVREQGLQKLYERTADKGRIEDLLHIDREMNNVRREIEVKEGQLKRWDKETSFSTVTVVLTQRKDYEVPGTAGFGTTIGRTWEGSIEGLLLFGKGLVLVAVAVTPWALAFGVVTSPLWLFIFLQLRKWRRRNPTPPAPPAPPPMVEQVSPERDAPTNVVPA